MTFSFNCIALPLPVVCIFLPSPLHILFNKPKSLFAFCTAVSSFITFISSPSINSPVSVHVLSYLNYFVHKKFSLLIYSNFCLYSLDS